jgi:hypothetical protein
MSDSKEVREQQLGSLGEAGLGFKYFREEFREPVGVSSCPDFY